MYARHVAPTSDGSSDLPEGKSETVNSNGSPSLASRNGLVGNFVFFSFWPRAQAAVNQWSNFRQLTLLISAIAIGVILRMWAQTSHRNYDFESYLLVSKLLVEGENPYSLGRYNYGPNWMFYITFFRSIFEDPDAFRILIAVTLTLADIGIAIVLFKRGYSLAAVVIMLSPISIAITGQHQQFDNIAIFLLLTAMAIYRPSQLSRWTGNDTLVLVLISLSITTKHVFLFFLIWFALKQPSLRKAAVFVAAPVTLFLLSLAPFWLSSPQDVTESVFLYSGYNNAPLLSIPIQNLEEMGVLGRRFQQAVFVVVVIGMGFLLRRLPPFTLALVYTVTLVVFTSTLADQYLSIALIGAAVFMNIGFLLWMILGTIYLFGNPETLAVPGVMTLHEAIPGLFTRASDSAYQLLTAALFLGWILMIISLRPEWKSPKKLFKSGVVNSSEG